MINLVSSVWCYDNLSISCLQMQDVVVLETNVVVAVKLLLGLSRRKCCAR